MPFFYRRKSRLLVSSILFTSFLPAISGCTALPGQGPTASDVVSTNHSAPTELRDGYVVTNLDTRVAEILAVGNASSFRGRFGDYRPAPNQTIGVGDTLTVTIWEASAGGLFSSPVSDRSSPGSHTAVIPEQVVTHDGSITVPYAGRIAVVGLTPPMVESKIIKALAGKAIEPQALVGVSRNLSNTVTIAGEVVQGARVPLSVRGDHILDVLATAGGVHAPQHESFITLTRDGRSVTVPLQALIIDPKENIFVRPGDTLSVERKPQSFSVFGAAGRNAVVTFDAIGISLEEALAKAGGLVDAQSDPEGVFLLRVEPLSVARQIDPNFVVPAGRTSVAVVYRINLRDPNTYFLARRVPVHNKDILYVANAPLTDLQKIMAIIAPSASMAVVGKSLAQ